MEPPPAPRDAHHRPGSPDAPWILAIDLGTSGPKVARVTLDGRILDHEFEPTGVRFLPGGGATQRPDDWWTAVTRATRRLLSRSPGARPRVRAVSVTGQWSGTVAVDADGRALGDALIWLDSRGSSYVRSITGGFPRIHGYGLAKLVTWITRTGGLPTRSGKDPVAHILFLRHEHPEVYERTFRFLEPKDYLNLVLTGRFAATHDSIALHWSTDNRDLARIDYDPRLLRMTTLPRDRLPDLVRTVDVLGPLRETAAAGLGIPAGTPVVGGTPDMGSAALGSGAVRDGQGHLCLGTSSWISCHVPFKKTDVLHNITTLPSAIPHRYFVVDEQEAAGACLGYLRDRLLFPDDACSVGPPPGDAHERIEALAATAPPGSRRVIFTPWLYGERTPVEDPTLRGGFHNLSLDTTRAELARAVLEGVAFNTRWLLGHVESFVGARFDGLHLIGGGALSPLWCQILADVLDRPVRVVEDPRAANARGAALLAAVALGELTFDRIPDTVRILRDHHPDRSRQGLYDELFGAFLEIHSRTRDLYARLNRKTWTPGG